MNGNDKLEKRKRTTRNICVLITVVFIIVMLILPLFSIIVSSLLYKGSNDFLCVKCT